VHFAEIYVLVAVGIAGSTGQLVGLVGALVVPEEAVKVVGGEEVLLVESAVDRVDGGVMLAGEGQLQFGREAGLDGLQSGHAEFPACGLHDFLLSLFVDFPKLDGARVAGDHLKVFALGR
jgi:hypothetical protein